MVKTKNKFFIILLLFVALICAQICFGVFNNQNNLTEVQADQTYSGFVEISEGGTVSRVGSFTGSYGQPAGPFKPRPDLHYHVSIIKVNGVPQEITEDIFFMDDYVMLDDKPKIIDEKNNSFKRIKWGCQFKNNISDSDKISCNCGCDDIFLNINIKEAIDGFYSGCNIFGDDYLADINDMDDGTDFIEGDIDIRDFEYTTENTFPLKISKQFKFLTDNKFLFFDRTCTGYTVNNWIDGSLVEYQGNKSRFKGNLFLLMNRTCTGYTVDTIDELRESVPQEYNLYKDIYNNALAFRITDKGEIGYRYYTIDCENENKCNIIEAYSKGNVIKNDEWYIINIKIKALNKSLMRIFFYVNGKLKFISKDIPILDLRQLNDLYEKQEGVPYNISLGGGTQGLAETILPNYMRNPYRVYPLEKYFAGTFIGYIKSFKFYQCKLNYSQINYNFQKQITN